LTVLVTGAAGFIGSAVANALRRSGLEILAVDNFTDYYARDLKELRVQQLLESNSVEFKYCDLSSDISVRDLFKSKKISKVFHLAAQPGVRISSRQTERYTQDNLVAFVNVLNQAKRFNVTDFLYASSSSVYGNSSEISFNERNSTPRPTSLYGATKLSNEIIASSASRETGIRTRGLRFFTVYGPWGRPDMVYFRIGASVLIGKEFTLNGDGSLLRDFTYIDDVVKSVLLLERQLRIEPIGFADVINIGGGISVNN
jgi:UDP-glucuronate 4-epimerase